MSDKIIIAATGTLAYVSSKDFDVSTFSFKDLEQFNSRQFASYEKTIYPSYENFLFVDDAGCGSPVAQLDLSQEMPLSSFLRFKKDILLVHISLISNQKFFKKEVVYPLAVPSVITVQSDFTKISICSNNPVGAWSGQAISAQTLVLLKELRLSEDDLFEEPSIETLSGLDSDGELYFAVLREGKTLTFLSIQALKSFLAL